MNMKNLLILLFMVAVVWKIFTGSGSVTLGPGVKVSELPLQERLETPVQYQVDNYTLTGVATFHIKAKVLSKKNYSLGREADLSPVDLALGWGNMSDESILDNIQISQSGRFYRWRVESFPIPRREIETSSANMHLIPANDSVKRAMKNVREGDIIEITGYLVNAKSNEDGWYWRSSQTRNDTGGGACELIWVETLNIATL